MNRPYPVRYATGMSLLINVCSACVETWTLPKITTWRRAGAGGQLAHQVDGGLSCRAQRLVKRHHDPLARTDVELHAARDRAAQLLFEQQTLGAQLHGVVVPDRGVAAVIARGRAVLGL